jgi:hypothetical protein
VRGAFGLTELQLLRAPRDESFEPFGVDLDVLGDSRYPSGVVSICAGAMRRRNRMMHPE